MPRHTNAALITRENAAAPSGAAVPCSFLAWYLGLIPHWIGTRSRLECRLLLRTHQWIVERVLDPEVDLADAAADLRQDGELTRILAALVPPDDRCRWNHFIQVVVANLRHALLAPVTRRNEAWLRWLFLIPYSIRPS